MFNGLIKHIGKTVDIKFIEGILELSILCDLPKAYLRVGNSIAVNGACFTVVSSCSVKEFLSLNPGKFDSDPEVLQKFEDDPLAHFGFRYNASKIFKVMIVSESLNRTTFKFVKIGDLLHLEEPLTMNSLLHGHMVSGHIDFCAQVLETGENLTLKIPKKFIKYFPEKSSICVMGVSLTVASVKAYALSLALIPATLNHTLLSSLKTGDKVNVEIDPFVKICMSILQK